MNIIRYNIILVFLAWLLFPVCSFATQVSDIENDEQVTFFRSAANLDIQKKQWHIPIHGWIYEPQDSTIRKKLIASLMEKAYDLTVSKATQHNFDRRVNLLIADNEAGSKIVVRIAGREFGLAKSQSNGHFTGSISLSVAAADRYANEGLLKYSAVLNKSDKRQFRGQVKLIQPTGISVISDIDDTVKVSQVTDHKKLFEYTFYKDFIPAPGMPVLYQGWSKRNVSFHFVSSSPWHLYEPLMEFSQAQQFPWATFSLKMIRLKDKTIMNLFKKGTETKPLQIEPILNRYPERKFILVGDSGEQDPEVYAALMRKHPKQIIKIFIRNVTQSMSTDSRYQTTFKGLSKNKWQLFTMPSEIRSISLF